MDYQTQSVVYGRDFLRTVLAAFKTDPGAALVATAKLRFSTDPLFNPTGDSVLADLEAAEADFTGYTAGGYTVTLSAPVNLSPTILGTEQFVLAVAADPTPPDLFNPNTVYGYWIDDGTNMILAEKFAGGVSAEIGQPGDHIGLTYSTPLTMNMSA